MPERKEHLIEHPENDIVKLTGDQMIVFTVGEQQYCVSILSIKEIREFETSTHLPHCPPYVEGAINIRGNIITVVNLSKYLNVPFDHKSERNVIIVIEDPERNTTCGLLANSVIGITEIKSEDIQAIDIDSGAPELDGLVNVDDKIVRILKVDSVIKSVLGDRPEKPE